MDIGTSSCLQKNAVWVNFISQKYALVVTFIVSWCEVSIRGVESPVAFEVGVHWAFFELVANSSLEYSLDFCKVRSSIIERLVSHPRDRGSLSKVLHPFACGPIQCIEVCKYHIVPYICICLRYFVVKRWQLCLAQNPLHSCYNLFHPTLVVDTVCQPPYCPILCSSICCWVLLALWGLERQAVKSVHTSNILANGRKQCSLFSRSCLIVSSAFANSFIGLRLSDNNSAVHTCSFLVIFNVHCRFFLQSCVLMSQWM